MKYCLVADDGEAQVVVGESNNVAWPYVIASEWSKEADCKFHVCRREPSANGENRVVIETWEKGKKV